MDYYGQELAMATAGASGGALDAGAAYSGEQEIPYSGGSSGGRFDFRNLIKGKITKKKAIIGGGIGTVIIGIIMGGGAMLALQPIHLLENLLKTYDLSSFSIIRRTAQVESRALFYNNHASTGIQRAVQRFIGISEKRATLFRDAGMDLICGGDHICGNGDLNAFGRYKTNGVQIFDQATGNSFDASKVHKVMDTSLTKKLKQVYNGKVARWYNKKSTAFFNKIKAFATRKGIIKDDPNRVLTQDEINALFAEQTKGKSSDSGNDKIGKATDVDDQTAKDAADQSRTSGKTSGVLSKDTKIKVAKALKGAGIVTATAGIGCTLFKIYETYVEYQGIVGKEQRTNFASTTLSEIETIKYGVAEGDVINGMMRNINAKSSYEIPDTSTISASSGALGTLDPNSDEIIDATADMTKIVTLSGPESDAWKYAVDGKKVTSPSPVIAENMNYLDTASYIKANSYKNPAMSFVAGGVIAAADSKFCSFVSNPWVQVGALVVTVVASVALAVLSAGGSVTVEAALASALGFGTFWAGVATVISIIAPIGLAMYSDQLFRAAVGNVFDASTQGQHNIAALVSGTSDIISTKGMNDAALTPTPTRAVSAYKDYQAYLKEEAELDREDRSPFDITSTNTFLGSFLVGFIPQASSLSSPSGFLGGIGALFNDGFASLFPSVKAADDLDNFEASLSNEWCSQNGAMSGVAMDIFCTPYRITADVKPAPEAVLQSLIDMREAEVVENSVTKELETKIHKVKYQIGAYVTRYRTNPKTGECVSSTNPEKINAYNPNGHNANVTTYIYDGVYDSSNLVLDQVDTVKSYPYTDWYENDGGCKPAYFDEREELTRDKDKTLKTASITGLYIFQKTYVERYGGLDKEELPTATLNEKGQQIDPEYEKYYAPNAILSGIPIINLFTGEAYFKFYDKDEENKKEYKFEEDYYDPCTLPNGTVVNCVLYGKIGVDDGSDYSRTLYSLFFIDQDIEDGLNGDLLYGSTVTNGGGGSN
ncbi:MAG: hypothetical protein LBM97_01635 [Candidatus Nomurabacteria bacterium]|jgi:hypothetical protein|nr:hypothetical protein [Candidatus Nomurabacteria bacterium]